MKNWVKRVLPGIIMAAAVSGGSQVPRKEGYNWNKALERAERLWEDGTQVQRNQMLQEFYQEANKQRAWLDKLTERLDQECFNQLTELNVGDQINLQIDSIDGFISVTTDDGSILTADECKRQCALSESCEYLNIFTNQDDVVTCQMQPMGTFSHVLQQNDLNGVQKFVKNSAI